MKTTEAVVAVAAKDKDDPYPVEVPEVIVAVGIGTTAGRKAGVVRKVGVQGVEVVREV